MFILYFLWQINSLSLSRTQHSSKCHQFSRAVCCIAELVWLIVGFDCLIYHFCIFLLFLHFCGSVIKMMDFWISVKSRIITINCSNFLA